MDAKQLNEALDRTLDEAKRWGIEVRMPRMPRQEIVNYYDQGIDLDNYECRNAWNTLFIGRQGNAYPCWIRKVGNVREHTIRELWNNAIMRKFRKDCQDTLFAPCPGCCFLEHKADRDATKLATPAAATVG